MPHSRSALQIADMSNPSADLPELERGAALGTPPVKCRESAGLEIVGAQLRVAVAPMADSSAREASFSGEGRDIRNE